MFDSTVTSATTRQRLKNWVFISGNRRVVAITLLVTVVVSLVVLNVVWPVEFRTLVTEEQTVQDLFQTLLSGIILLVSIVVSINSLVVSQELTPIGNQHERVIESWDFRTRTAETVDADVAPAAIDEFLQQLVETIVLQLDQLSADIDEESEDLTEEISDYTEETVDYLNTTRDLLAESSYGNLDTRLFSPLYDPSEGLESARRLRRKQGLPDALDDSLEQVIESFQYYVTAREYFKTIYYKREFSRLSRDLLYSGLPSILLMTYVVLAVDAKSFLGTTMGIQNLTLFFSLSYVVALSPFFILTSYVLRAAVIAEQTVTAGAFTVE